MKRLGIAFLLAVAVLGCLLLYGYFSTQPPGEKKLIANFQAHRAAFEHLRDMLRADKQFVRIARWGVETTSSPLAKKPEEVGFPVGRHHEYLGLFREVGAISASPGPGNDAEVLVWASGWAGDTRHQYICWKETEPSPLVDSLDQFYQTRKPRNPVYKRIDGNWYLWADW